MTMIYGEEPELQATDSEAVEPAYIAVYVDEAGKVVAQCICDIGATASLACALSLIPIPTAQEMIQTRSLSPIAEENLHEVMNIFSSLFMNDKSEHLTLGGVYTETQDPARPIAGTQTIGFAISGVKYPKGQILFTSL
jgi:hypothetical protein